MSTASRRTAGVAGILGVLLPVVGLFVLPIWDFPGTGTSGAELVRWAADHQGRLQVVMLCNTFGVTLWLVLGAAVRTGMRQVLPDGSVETDLFGAGIAVMVALLLSGFTAFDVLVYRADDLAGSDARLLYDLTFGLLAMSGMPAAVGLGAFAVAVRRDRFVPAWLGIFAAVTAASHVVLLGSLIVPRGHASLEGWSITVIPGFLFAWIFATGVVLFRDSRPS